jgi:protein NrfD
MAVVLHGVAAARPVTGPMLTALSALSSAALLGGACTSMVLGHWYLVLPSLEVSHLQRLVGYHILTLAARIVIVAVALVLARDVPLVTGQSLVRYVSSVGGIFFWQRVLFGLAAPAVLSYLTWETAKIRSTQSATGILYVDFFTVVVGEMLANYVLLSTGLAV